MKWAHGLYATNEAYREAVTQSSSSRRGVSFFGAGEIRMNDERVLSY